MTFENIEAKGEIAHDEQFLLLPRCLQLYLMIILSFMEIFHIFAKMFHSRLLQICHMCGRVK